MQLPATLRRLLQGAREARSTRNIVRTYGPGYPPFLRWKHEEEWKWVDLTPRTFTATNVMVQAQAADRLIAELEQKLRPLYKPGDPPGWYTITHEQALKMFPGHFNPKER